jgi:voltage-gated potassium channel
MNQLQHKNEYLNTGLINALILMALLLCFGILGYYFFFDYALVDAIYMTVITVGTVGFGEVNPLDSSGKIFTSILILLSIFIFAYAVTTISAFLISVNSIDHYKKRKMQQKINALKDHTILCGYGRNGKQAAIKLKNYKKAFVIIEQNQQAIRMLAEEGLIYIEGNATDDEVLIRAGIQNAKFLITTLPSDSDNVFIALTAKQLNSNIHIYSRASEDSSIKKLKIAGAQHVVMPDKIGGEHMASLIVAPDLVEFIDNLSDSSNGHMKIQEIILSTQPNVRSLDELAIKEKTGCTVIGYKTSLGEYIINPAHDLPVEYEGRVIVLGNEEQINKLNQAFRIF